MSDIALRTYVEQLDNLIERKQVDEAVAHCRHILSYYPKHVDTYRILGKALLEKGRHGDAADIFQRVLSVLPDDFIAHVGMAIIREDEANLEAAIWHMERAFESTPSNGAIQQELCRLIGRRDGVVPPKARLTRGALARMYTLGGLYLQAEAELKAALAEDADRVDLQALLAQVYWHTDQAALAAQTSGQVLQKLPYNQPANRILFDLFRAQGRADDAAGYRRRLEALDPYEALAGANGYHDARDVEADKVTLPRLDYVPGMESGGSPDWIASIGARFEDRDAEADEDTPDWLRAAASPASQALDEQPEGGDLPAWLQEAAANAPDLGAPVEAAAPTWLSDLGNAESPDDDLPDWLRAASTGPLAGDEVPGWMQGAPGAAPETPAAEQTMPGWMRDAASGLVEADSAGEAAGAAGETEAAEAAPAEAARPPALASDDDVPAWLKTVTPSAPGEEVPDWLAGLAGTQDEAPEQPALPAEVTPPADLPDWLAGVAANADTGPAVEAPPAAEAGDSLPAWLAPEEPEQADEPTEPNKMAEEAAAEAPATAPEPIPGYDSLPDWLHATAAAAEQPEPAAEAPTAPMPPAAAADDLAAGDLPDWLKTLQAHTQAEASLPPWLQGLPDDDEAGGSALPDWLDDLDTPQGTPSAPAGMDAADATMLVPPPASPEPASPEATFIAAQPEEAADELPDWLKPETPPESTPLGTVAAAAATLAAVPEWLKRDETADADEAGSADLDAEAAPEALADEAPFAMDMPDWLKAAAANAPPPDAVAAASEAEPPAGEAPPAAESEAAALASAAGPAVELPDFLQPASPEAIARAEQPYTFDDEAAEAEAAGEDAEPVPADIPDWLKALRPEPAADEAPAVSQATAADLPEDIDLSDVPDWLAAPAAETAASAVDMNEAAAGEVEAPLADEVPADQLPDWLRESAGQAAADLPPWAQPQAPGPTDTVVNWLAGKEVPEWLRELRAQPGEAQAAADEAQAPASEAQPPAADAQPASPEALEATGPMASAVPPPAEPVVMPEATTEGLIPDAPDLDNMDPEEAMRWLEGLAARQGAAAETLFTLDTAPAAGAVDSGEVSTGEGGTDEVGTLPDWLRQAEAEMPADELADTAPRGAATPEAPAAAASEPAEPAAMDEDEALRWLESLAARQGAPAEELLTSATAETVETPDWVAAEAEAAAPTMAEPASAVETEPDEAEATLAEAAAEAAAELAEAEAPAAEIAAAHAASETLSEAPPEAPTAEAPAVAEPDRDRLSRLADRLASARRAREADIEARFAERRAQEEAARREVQARMAAQRAAMEAASVPRRKQTEPLAPPPAPAAEQQAAEPAAMAPAPAAPAEPVAVPPPAAHTPRRLRGRRAPAEAASPLAGQPPEALLAQARQHIEARDYAAAAEALGALVRSGQHLDEAVAALEAAAADPAAPAVVLRALGDAYNRANRVPQALEAYRRALTRL